MQKIREYIGVRMSNTRLLRAPARAGEGGESIEDMMPDDFPKLRNTDLLSLDVHNPE